MKILGVTLDRDCSFRSHVESIRSRLRSRTWALARLRKKGLSEDRLVRAYKCLIRPVAEYAAPAWHSLITAEQAEKLERQQSQALKNIFGCGVSAEKMRKKANIPLLSARREEMLLKFGRKCLNNPRCEGWFVERNVPSYSRRSTVRYAKYREPNARTDRYRNSPKNYLIRKLNANM